LYFPHTSPPPRSTLFPYTTLFRSWRALTLNQLGMLAWKRGRPDEARGWYLQALEAWERLGNPRGMSSFTCRQLRELAEEQGDRPDRKSTRLNSSHRTISYAVFCLN